MWGSPCQAPGRQSWERQGAFKSKGQSEHMHHMQSEHMQFSQRMQSNKLKENVFTNAEVLCTVPISTSAASVHLSP